ncbi:MAG: universal stress protein [Nitrososphaeraceae archaeon]
MIIRKVLVAVDGSIPSLNASSYAIDLAKKFDAELTILYVISSDLRYTVEDMSPVPKALKQVLAVATERGQEKIDQVKRRAVEKNVGVKTDIILSVTSVVKEIADYAKKNNIDVIVVGSRGISGFKKMLLGSVASGVVTFAHCPVIVVK